MASRIGTFLSELRRRRVFRVAAVYAGVTFVIIQIIDGTFAVMGIPDWISRLIIILLLMGFPIAIGLAWAFDITDEGIVRTKGKAAATATTRPFIGNTTLGIVASLAILVAAWSWFGRGGMGDSALDPTLGPKSIAVLPFANLSASKEDEYFSDGVTDDIITHLTKIGDLKVVSRTSTMLYKGSRKSLRVIAEELGVSNILEGSVRRAGNRVRITSQLIDARTDEHLWAETYDRNLTDIFAIQSDVARNIAAALKAILSPEERQRIQQRPTESPAAYDYYLRAIEYERQGYDRKTREIASDLYKKAIAVDSSFAQAYARLGRNFAFMYRGESDRTSQLLGMAREAVDEALRLKPDDPVVRVANGYYYYHGFRDYARALEEFYFARRMEPGNGLHAQNIAYIQRRLGKFEEAVTNLKTALEYDPRSFLLSWELGWTYRFLRWYDLAEQSYDRTIVMAPEFTGAYRDKAWLQVYRTGNTKSARQVLEEGIRLTDHTEFSWTLVDFDIEDSHYSEAFERLTAIPEDVREYLVWIMPKEAYAGWIFELMAKPAEARRHYENARVLLDEMVRESPDEPSIHSALGLVYAHLGLADEAIRNGRKAVDLRPVSLDAFFGPAYLEGLAEVYTIVGEHDEALEIIEQLLEIPGLTSIGSLKFHRVWDPLREHPRFKALMEKYGEN